MKAVAAITALLLGVAGSAEAMPFNTTQSGELNSTTIGLKEQRTVPTPTAAAENQTTSESGIKSTTPMETTAYEREISRRSELFSKVLARDTMSSEKETRHDANLKYIANVILGSILASSGIVILVTLAEVGRRRMCRHHKCRPRTATAAKPLIAHQDQQKLQELARSVEFPRDRVVVGNRSADGFFAEVYNADALGIIPQVNRTRITVKKPRLKDEGIQAFKRELKILTTVGENSNVVRLLGAVTDKLDVDRPMLLLEFLELGSILEYLIENRNKFRADCVDMDNIADLLKPHPPSRKRMSQRIVDLCRGHFKPSKLDEHLLGAVGNPVYFSYENLSTACHKPTSPEAMPRSIKVLLSWSSQVAHGMQWLASKNIIHGNLAARNIHLKTNYTVKITNFALAKKLKKDQTSCKRKAGFKSPVRWAAIELLTDELWSLKSDVWSYGVVMWEMFSLGKEPYHEFSSLDEIYHALLLNHRMKRPEHAPRRIYELMKRCWEFDRGGRPEFSALAIQLDQMLYNTVHHVDVDRTVF